MTRGLAHYLRAIERHRRDRDRADAAYRDALVEAIDAGHSYRAVADRAGLSAGRVHEIVAAERQRLTPDERPPP